MTFGEALSYLRTGYAVQREGWNGPGQFVALKTPSESSDFDLPCLVISTVEGKLVPWTVSQTDVLAEDWQIAHEPRD